VLPTSRSSAITIGSSLRWPQFFLVENTDRFLWGQGREILQISRSEAGSFRIEPDFSDLTLGLNRLVAAAHAPNGTLAVLDASGRVAVQIPRSRQLSTFETHLENSPGDLAMTNDKLYLLLQGESEGGSAVVSYSFFGAEVGRWGTMPVDGIIQANLKGGGIAACPDGSIFYSYINSPRILRLDTKEHRARVVGRANRTFHALTEGQVHQAQRESTRSRSVAPLVKLGLEASRVMALRCSPAGILRQVARPSGGGALIEVWDPHSETLLGTVPAKAGILLDVQGNTLFLGALRGGEPFLLDRVELSAPPARTRVASR
jgi:hypothetical protein